MTRRYFITGARGFVGSSLTAQLLAADPEAVVLGIGRSPGAGRGRFSYRALPIGHTDALRRTIAEFSPDCVFHLASALHTAPERELIETNIGGTASLLQALSECRARLVVASSAGVYGHSRRLPIEEAQPCAPVNAYGATKLAAEQLVREQRPDAITARIFNVTGPGQRADHVCGRFAAQLVEQCLTLEAGPLSPTRDFLDVRDVAAALIVLSQRASSGNVVNVASGNETSIGEVLSQLVQAANREVTIVEQTDLSPGVSRSVADVTRLRALGFKPAYSLEQSLADLFSAACSDMRSSRAARSPA
jgi:nucleoside-diphosphate-sugar epimerase